MNYDTHQQYELTDEEYWQLYREESERRNALGLNGPPFVTRHPTLMHPQNPEFKRWLEEDLERNP